MVAQIWLYLSMQQLQGVFQQLQGKCRLTLTQLCQDVDAQDVLADRQRMFPGAGQLNGESHRPQEFPVWFLLFSSGVTGAFHSSASSSRLFQEEAELSCGH